MAQRLLVLRISQQLATQEFSHLKSMQKAAFSAFAQSQSNRPKHKANVKQLPLIYLCRRYESNLPPNTSQTPPPLQTDISTSSFPPTVPPTDPLPSPPLTDTPYLPEPPSIPDPSLFTELNALGEPTLSSLGLCSYWPAGWIQSFLEYIHVTANLPWWATFSIFAVSLRVVLIPLQVFCMKKGIEQQNIVPKYMELQTEFKDAQHRNDLLQAALTYKKLQAYMDEHKPRPLLQMLGPAYQVPVFLSVLSAIRGMANLPVESLKTGGSLWFPDLTVADPYFLLPILTGTTLLLSLESGAEGMRTSVLAKNTKYALRGFCMFVPVFMMWQPSALAVYWFSSNVMAVSIMTLLRMDYFKKLLSIPELKKPDLKESKSNEGFVAKYKRSIKEKQIQSHSSQREGINAKAFADAGRSAPVKTFKYDPTRTKVIHK